MPFKTEVHVMGQKRNIMVSEVRHNIELPENIFDIPEEIKELQGI